MVKDSKPSFLKILTSNDFTQRLQLPPSFVKTHTTTLYEDSKFKAMCCGESWDVMIKEQDEFEGNARPCHFTTGWNEFARDFRLQLGESVLFWFDVKDSTFEVAVYEVDGCEKKLRDDNDDDVDNQDGLCDKEFVDSDDSETDEAESKTEIGAEYDNSSYPKFERVVNRYIPLHVPIEFAKEAGLLNAKSVTLEYPLEGRYWTVKLNKFPNRDTVMLKFGSGWMKFCEDNRLETGKICSFMFNAVKNIIQVQCVNSKLNNISEDDVPEKKRKRSIVSAQKLSSHSNLDTPCSSSKSKHQAGLSISDKKMSMAYRRAEAYMDEKTIHHLSFVSYMGHTYISTNCMNIKQSILRDNFQSGNFTIKLRDANGKSWPVTCSNWGNNRRLSSGWLSFVKDNGIKVGDACIFELSKSDRFVWNVTIFRN